MFVINLKITDVAIILNSVIISNRQHLIAGNSQTNIVSFYSNFQSIIQNKIINSSIIRNVTGLIKIMIKM